MIPRTFKKSHLVASMCLSATIPMTSHAVIEEIIVSAEKIGERSIQDTPLAITAYSGDQIENQGILSTADLLNITPGVSVAQNIASSATITVRGVSPYIGDSAVGYYLDNQPFSMIGSAFVPNPNPYDLNRVEVLKGPQGTLYGASSIGGTIRIITNDPDFEGVYGKVDAIASTTEDGGENWALQGALNVPLIKDTLAMRVVLATEEKDGYIDLISEETLFGVPTGNDGSIEDYNDMERQTARVKLLFTPNERLTVKASYWYSKNDTFSLNATEDYTLTQNNIEFTAPPAIGGAPTGLFVPIQPDQIAQIWQFDMFSVSFEYEFDNFILSSSSSWFDSEQTINLGSQGFRVDFPADNKAFSQETLLTFTGNDRFYGTMGFFYNNADQQQPNTEAGFFLGAGVPGATVLLPVNIQIRNAESEQWAVFGEAHMEFAEDWKLTLGLRYFEDERLEEDTSPNNAPVFAALGLPSSFGETFDATTWRVNLSYTPNEDTLIYTNIATGFRSGIGQQAVALLPGVAAGATPVLFTDREDLISYEVGAKLTLLDGRLVLDGAVYYQEMDDVIVTFRVAPASDFSVNSEGASGAGVDFGFQYLPTDHLQVAFSLGWNEFEYDSTEPQAGIVEGDRVLTSPEWTYSGSLTYSRPLADSGFSLFGFANFATTTEKAVYNPDLPTVESDETTFVNLRVGVENDTWGVYLFGENVTDENGAVLRDALGDAQGRDPLRARPPTYGINVKYNF